MPVNRIVGQWILIILLLGGAVACSSVVSPQIKQSANKVTFMEIKQNPSAYKGEIVIWGGTLLDTVRRGDTTAVVVLEVPLTMNDRPSNQRSRGRFIAMTSEDLDRQFYSKGKQVTIAGEVIGSRGQAGRGLVPIISIKEIHAWTAIEDRAVYDFVGTYDRPAGSWWWW
jgi:outer membrane lipoprotein